MAIEQIEMFKELSKLDLAKLLGKLEKITLRTGDTLFEQGDLGEGAAFRTGGGSA